MEHQSKKQLLKHLSPFIDISNISLEQSKSLDKLINFIDGYAHERNNMLIPILAFIKELNRIKELETNTRTECFLHKKEIATLVKKLKEVVNFDKSLLEATFPSKEIANKTAIKLYNTNGTASEFKLMRGFMDCYEWLTAYFNVNHN